MPDPLVELITAAAAQDELVKQAVRKLAFEVVHEAHNLLSKGSPATRMSVIRSLLPSLVRSLEKNEETEGTKELQKQLGELMAEVRSGAKVVLDVTPHPAPAEDTPYPRRLGS